ncbi:uncharacterized protein Aven [Drosophila tropicalis]|uniref:uncharacterized protein Aven n=1 Tax=Drosophila tropicalis TaxID=46794 RepID=UPI0035ABA706
MLGKDDRSKDKRKKMKQLKQTRRGTTTTTTSSSSPPGTAKARSIVDIADSSDEPRFNRKPLSSAGGGGNWSSSRPSSLAAQKNRDLVGTLPPTDDTDDLELDLNGAPIDENARAQLRAADYQQLSQFASMGGGHFSFGAEKEWNNIGQTKEQAAPISQKLFTLNLGLLNSGLQTIPFYKLMDYPTSMFTRQQLQEQNKAAERAEKVYQQRVLSETNGTASGKSRISSAKVPGTAVSATATSNAPAPSQPDELDELLALTDTTLNLKISTPIIQPATPSSNSKTDVEQWLDTVLDE